MWYESEIQNFKNIFLEEMSCYDQDLAEKVFDEWFEKVSKIAFSGIEGFVELIKAVKMPAEFVQYLLDSLDNDNGVSPEERGRNALRFAKELSY